MTLRARLLRLRGLLWFLPWAVLAALSLQAGPYGLSEGGAKAVLLAWSMSDQVASAAVTLGAPDVRFLLFLPLGALWPGQILAAKALTLVMMVVAAIALYQWRSRDDQSESALLATGVLMLCPLTLASLDGLGTAPFLLVICGTATWLADKLGGDPGTFGGSFFAQLLLCAAAVSLHPAGLAYPAMLLWIWWRHPPDQRHRQYFLLGVPFVVVLVLVMRLGWGEMAWWQNPLPATAALFGGALVGGTLSVAGALGAVALLVTTAIVAVHEHKRLLADLSGGTLLLGAVFGAFAADRSWALLVLALLLYAGLPWLLRASAVLADRGLIAQRGWLWLLLILVCTVFLSVDKFDFEATRRQILSAQDRLISDFVDGMASLRAKEPLDAAHPAKPIIVASSWPARTAIACQCDGLPLPPAAKDPRSQLAMMRGVGYVILGDDPVNRPLAYNFAQLGQRIEVLAREPGGVVLHLRPPPANP